jgi:uncharacterized protein (DUF3084 family)
LQGQVIDLARQYEAIHEQHLSIRRQSANIRREMKSLDETDRELKEHERALEKRRCDLEFHDRDLSLRRAAVDDEENELQRRKAKKKRLARKVYETEARSRDSELSNTILFEQIQDESAQLSIYMLELGQSRGRRSVSPSLQEELAASFLDFE